MRDWSRTHVIRWSLLALLAAPFSAAAAEPAPLLARIKAVGREGAGSVEAAEAWRELVRLGPDALPAILGAMDDADARAANWLRLAVDAIAEREVAAGRKLPADKLEAFVAQKEHSGRARRLAFEWLARVDATAPKRLLPGMLHDPAAELRRDAVALYLKEADQLLEKGEKPAATAAYRKVLEAVRDPDQVEQVAKQLQTLGVEVDLAVHFGFVRKWMLAGPFDNMKMAGFDKAHPPEKGVDLKAKYMGKDGAELAWRAFATDHAYGMVDFNKAIAKHMGAGAYAYAVIESPAERAVQVRAGSNNAVKIWVNGKLIYFRDEYHHGQRMDQHTGAATLRAGRNEVLIKVCQNEQTEPWAQRWDFQLRVCDALGGAVPMTVATDKVSRGPGRDIPEAVASRPSSVLAARLPDAAVADSQFRTQSSPAGDEDVCQPAASQPPAAVPGAAAPSWPQFRGAGGTAVSEETRLPVKWGEGDNIRWKVELPGRGVSSPVIAGGRVYVTACTGYQQDRLHVLCFEAATGKKLWERQLWATGPTLCHAKTSMAGGTPATDGQRVYALFATGDLVCFDADGNLVWYRALVPDYPTIGNNVGMAASLVLWKDTLLVPMENVGESFAAGLDKLTGRNRWRTERLRDINWVTPLVIANQGSDEVLFQTRTDLTAYDPATGKQRWTYKANGLSSIPSPTAANGVLVVPGNEMVALRPGKDGAAPEVLWKNNKLRTSYATPLVYRDRLYLVTQAALACADLATGKVLWQERVEGPFSASLVAGDGKIYVVNEKGTTTVVQAGAEPRVLAINDLGGPMLATPAIAGGSIYLRSDQYLYCIGEKKDK